MTNYPNDPSQPGGYGEQPKDGSGTPQYGSPQYGSSNYGAPQYGAPQQGGQYGAQPYGSAQYGAPEQGGQYGAPADHKHSVLVLVLGIASIPTMFCYVGIVLGIIAIVMGRKTLHEIDASGGTIGGRGKAQAGFVCGIIGTALSAVIIVLAVVAIASGHTTTP